MITAFQQLIKAIFLIASCVAIGWFVAEIAVELEMLKQLNENIHYAAALITIPLGFAWRIINSLNTLIGHDATSASENTVLVEEIKNRVGRVWELIFLCVFTTFLLSSTKLLWEIIPTGLSYLLLVYSVTFTLFSLLTLGRIYAIDREVLYFLSEMTTRDKRHKAKEKALKTLDKNNSDFSESEKSHLRKYSCSIELTENDE